MVELSFLTAEHDRRAAQLLTEAFVDDAFWLSVMPTRPRLRRAIVRRQSLLEVVVCRRGGRPALGALEPDGTLVGIALFHPRPTGRRPGVPLLASHPLWLGGPGAVRRGLALDRTLHEIMPDVPHLYLDQLAVAADRRRTGVGTLLLHAVLDEVRGSGLPVFLETLKEENIAYYERFGFAVSSEAELPGAHRVWGMLRPGSNGAGRPPTDR